MKVEIFFSKGENIVITNLLPENRLLRELYDRDCFDTCKIIEEIKEGKLKSTHFLNMNQVLFVKTTPDDAEKTVLVKEEEEAYEESHDNDNGAGFFDRLLSFFSR